MNTRVGLTHTHTHALTHTLSLFHTHTHKHTNLSLSLSLSHTHTHTHNHTQSLSLTHTFFPSLSLSYTHAHTHFSPLSSLLLLVPHSSFPTTIVRVKNMNDETSNERWAFLQSIFTSFILQIMFEMKPLLRFSLPIGSCILSTYFWKAI